MIYDKQSLKEHSPDMINNVSGTEKTIETLKSNNEDCFEKNDLRKRQQN